jgi:hypothetical protein
VHSPLARPAPTGRIIMDRATATMDTDRRTRITGPDPTPISAGRIMGTVTGVTAGSDRHSKQEEKPGASLPGFLMRATSTAISIPRQRCEHTDVRKNNGR